MTGNEQTGRLSGPSGGGFQGRAVVVLVLVVALICGTVTAWLLWTAGAGADQARAERLHRVTATTTGTAQPSVPQAGQSGWAESVAPAVWTYPKDVRRSGTIDVPPLTPRGRAVPVWVDAAGSPVRPPDSETEHVLTSFCGGAAAAATTGAATAGVLLVVRRRAEARTFAALEREWAQVEPVWSGRPRKGSGGPGADGH
ncbi:hypothetical protein ACFVWY_10935 [Streptomyces sp. NPDC058195]|uniref:Rv1733c family protein n=1 Tax=Streptomyces sp. NPDC058195 TaxID=3346375 RepID=UPI0036EA4F4F